MTDTFHKTEELLKNYNYLLFAEGENAKKVITQIDKALEAVRDDPYYAVITMYYISGESREEIANSFRASVTTITRNKIRLINIIKKILFSDEFIRNIYG